LGTFCEITLDKKISRYCLFKKSNKIGNLIGKKRRRIVTDVDTLTGCMEDSVFSLRYDDSHLVISETICIARYKFY
jgi:hypothetical protein